MILSTIFIIMMVGFLFRMIRFAIRASWSILKVCAVIILFPVLLGSLAWAGLTILALILLGIGAIASFVVHA